MTTEALNQMADDSLDLISVTIGEAARDGDQTRLLAIQCELMLSVVRRLTRLERQLAPSIFFEGRPQ